MKTLVFLILAGIPGMATASSMGRPNCPVFGNWSDPEGGRTMSLSLTTNEQGNLVTEQMRLNTSWVLLTHEQTRPINNTVLGTPTSPLIYYPSNVTRPDGHVEQETVVVEARCINDLLYVMVIPVSENSISSHVNTFTLRRQQVPVLSEALPPTAPPSNTPAIPATPQFILVNISLPRRQDDDVPHMEDATDSQVPAAAQDYSIVGDS
ncbi:hypothetical protein E2C01_094973 [Portunus trituberculatus]|uniref:Uncharacterized protein n=1 Tax=Portunus trituberculatus TaxID=210409 RepID=A0A5B7JTX4_PORTR|nr:hypothetical protein [Portunus trituberculatus]